MDLKEIKSTQENTSRHPWELSRAEIIIQLIKKYTGASGASKLSIVDVGCGDMYVLEAINNAVEVDEIFGVDIALNNEEIERLDKKYLHSKISIYNDSKKITVKKENQTLVLLLDVIEHVEDDKGFLEELQKHSFVNERTVFFVTVPSFQSLYCSHDAFLGHYRRYSNSQLARVLESAGYELMHIGYFYFVLVFPRLIKVGLEKMFAKKDSQYTEGTGLTYWNRGAFISFILKSILLADYYILLFLRRLYIKLPGLSNIVVCKRSV